MTIEQFEENIGKVKQLKNEIEQLIKFKQYIKYDEEVVISVYNYDSNSNKEHKILGRYIQNACDQQLEVILDNYDSYIKTLQENGIDISNEFKARLI